MVHLYCICKPIWACRRVGVGGKRPAGLCSSLGPDKVQKDRRTGASIWELKEESRQRAERWSQLFHNRNPKSSLPYLLTVVLVQTMPAMSQEADRLLRALRTGTQRWHEQQKKLPSRSGKAQEQTCCRPALQTAAFISDGMLSPSTTANLRSLKSLQKCGYINSPNVRV